MVQHDLNGGVTASAVQSKQDYWKWQNNSSNETLQLPGVRNNHVAALQQNHQQSQNLVSSNGGPPSAYNNVTKTSLMNNHNSYFNQYQPNHNTSNTGLQQTAFHVSIYHICMFPIMMCQCTLLNLMIEEKIRLITFEFFHKKSPYTFVVQGQKSSIDLQIG